MRKPNPAISFPVRLLTFNLPTANVLFVEPDETLREIYAEFLTDEGYGVLQVGTGQQAIECIRSNRLEIVVSELELPDKSGPEIARSAEAEQPDCKILIISNFFMMPEEQFSYPTLAKPFRPSDLVRAIKVILRN